MIFSISRYPWGFCPGVHENFTQESATAGDFLQESALILLTIQISLGILTRSPRDSFPRPSYRWGFHPGVNDDFTRDPDIPGDSVP